MIVQEKASSIYFNSSIAGYTGPLSAAIVVVHFVIMTESTDSIRVRVRVVGEEVLYEMYDRSRLEG